MPDAKLWRVPVVLASGSASRRRLLEAAGLSVVIDKPDVDEDQLKRRARESGLDTERAAASLAAAKAERVAPRHSGRIVIAGDQMLDCDGVWFDKPADREAAHRQLAQLSGRTHRLVSAAIAVRDGVALWQAVDIATLAVRPLSAAFIDQYLDAVGSRVCDSVGAYQIEGLGVQLFERVEGDHFTVMGLPLLPLLAFLRAERVLES
jgi:septum formation protein